MFRSIFGKTLYEKRWFLLAWSLGLFTMAFVTMVFFPYFKNAGFEQVIASAPESLKGLLGDASSYMTVVGYVDQQVFALRMPMLTIVMAVALFVSVGVADEDRGTLETLLALPVSRTKVFLQKLFAGAVISAVASVFIALGVWATFGIIHGSMSISSLAQATLGCWLLTMVFGVLTYAIGAATGKRGLTIGVASAVAFVSYLVTSLAPAVDKLDQVQKASVFYYYNTPSIAQHGLQIRNVSVLVGITVVLSVVSLLAFRHRDLVRD